MRSGTSRAGISIRRSRLASSPADAPRPASCCPTSSLNSPGRLSPRSSSISSPAARAASTSVRGLRSNGYGEHSPGGYPLPSAFVTEVVMTAGFLFVIMGATDKRAPAALAPLAIGLTLTLIHLISIPVTNTSVNPTRSTGPALLVGGWALQQLWIFWLAPILGGIIGAVAYRWLAAPAPMVAADVPAAAD